MLTPVFVYDSREEWFPVGVEESLRVAAAKVPEGLYQDGERWSDQRIDLPSDMTQPDLEPVGYHRVIPGDELWWSQFWLWYLYNSWSIAGEGKHEGDWEFVQLGCTDEAGDHPVLVTASQHHGGGKREAWSCVHYSQDTRRPVLYVAEGSHANYFGPGLLGGGIDRCNGQGRVIADIEWREFGTWASWPGRW